MIEGVWLSFCFWGGWSNRDNSESTKGKVVDDVRIAINTSLRRASALEHQDGVPGKSGVLKSA